MNVKCSPLIVVILAGLASTGCFGSERGQSPTTSPGTATPILSSTPIQKQITLATHNLSPQGLDWSPDGKLIAEADGYDKVNILDAQTGELVSSVESTAGDMGNLYASIAFSPDSKYFVVGEDFGDIVIREAHTGAPIRHLRGLGEHPISVAWSPDGTQVAGIGAKGVLTWDVTTGQRQLSIPDANPQSVAYSPDGRLLAVGYRDGDAVIWDARTGALIHRLSVCKSRVFSVTFSPDGKTLATSTEFIDTGDQIKLWDVQAGTLLSENKMVQNAVVTAAHWSPGGQFIASTSWSGPLFVWDASRQTLLFSDPINATALAWSPDGTSLAITDGQHIIIYNMAAYPEAESALASATPLVAGPPVAVQIGTPEIEPTPTAVPKPLLPDRQVAVPTTYFGPLPSGALTQLGLGLVYKSAQSPDGSVLAAATALGIVAYRISPSEPLWVSRTDYRVDSLSWSPDGKLIAAASGEINRPYAVIVDAATGRLLHELRGHKRTVGSMSWSPDGKRLLTGGRDGVAIIWDAATGQPLKRLVRTFADGTRSDDPRMEYHDHTVSFNADGTRVAGYFYYGAADYGAVDDKITLWNASTGEQLSLLDASSGISLMSWSPHDPNEIAIGLEDSRIHLVNVGTGNLVAGFEGINVPAWLEWTPDSKVLISLDGGGNLFAWDMATFKERYSLENAGNQFIWSPDPHSSRPPPIRTNPFSKQRSGILSQVEKSHGSRALAFPISCPTAKPRSESISIVAKRSQLMFIPGHQQLRRTARL